MYQEWYDPKDSRNSLSQLTSFYSDRGKVGSVLV